MFKTNTPSFQALHEDFIHPSRITTAFRKIRYSQAHFLHFNNTLPTQDAQAWGRENNCLLIPGPPKPLSLLHVRDLKRGNFQEQYGGWYFQKDFADKDTVNPKWIMLRKELIPGSVNKDLEGHLAMIPPREKLLNATELAWCLTVYKAINGVHLLQNIYTRTSSTITFYDSLDVVVGSSCANGIAIYSIGKNARKTNVGLLTALKID